MTHVAGIGIVAGWMLSGMLMLGVEFDLAYTWKIYLLVTNLGFVLAIVVASASGAFARRFRQRR